MTTTSPILQSFALERLDEKTFCGESVQDDRRPVVYGGKIMGQMIVAASRFEPAKTVKSLHLIFARSGTTKQAVRIDLAPVHSGLRSPASPPPRPRASGC